MSECRVVRVMGVERDAWERVLPPVGSQRRGQEIRRAGPGQDLAGTLVRSRCVSVRRAGVQGGERRVKAGVEVAFAGAGAESADSSQRGLKACGRAG